MASLETRHGFKKGPRFRLVFRLHGRKYQQVLAASTQFEAEQIKTAAERTLDLLAEGRMTVSEGADVGLFVTTDGRVAKTPTKDSTLQLSTLFETYRETLPTGTATLERRQHQSTQTGTLCFPLPDTMYSRANNFITHNKSALLSPRAPTAMYGGPINDRYRPRNSSGLLGLRPERLWGASHLADRALDTG